LRWCVSRRDVVPRSRAPPARRALYRVGLRRAPCSGSRAHLGVCAGSLPTASRSGPWSPSHLPSLERESIFVPRRTAAAYRPADRRPIPAARAYRGRRRAGELRRCVPSPRPPIKAAHRPARARPLHTGGSVRASAPEDPLLWLSSLQSSTSSQFHTASTISQRHPCPSQTGRPPEQGAPRPGSLGAVGRPATGASPPICGHKSMVGKPLVLPHPSPGQGRHRSGPIPASRAALLA
jgi:hypothetical protein